MVPPAMSEAGSVIIYRGFYNEKTIKLFIAMLLFVVPVILLIVLLGYAKQLENQGTEEPLETEESKMPETAESLPEEPEIVYDPPEYTFTTDEITVYIGGLTEEYTIAFVNDLHLVTDTEVGHVLEEELPEVMKRYNELSVTADGKHAEDLWPEVIKYLNYNDFDAVIFGGDLLDYCSPSNIEVLEQGFDQLKYDRDRVIYLRSDHDYIGTYGGSQYTDADGVAAQAQLWDGDSEEKVIDLGEFLIVGINRSYQNLSDERLEYLNRELRDGRPVIVATHVPFYSEEDAESLEARSMEIRNRIYYWNKTDSVYSPDENTQKFIDEMYAPGSNVVQILAAHLHASWDGKATKKVGEHIFAPAYSGSIGIIHVTGQKVQETQMGDVSSNNAIKEKQNEEKDPGK